ncbi:hypothetical protein DSO57_1017996 [Entomophthora muscae]|uniref:Uncharacterized protein n=1 Tax=Entomophthora muscae TaxID=34485 RepID=A0ACC2STJ3_9FUNG|nr:hypothetical protein DSO57_1017996 [Entomophthora muscae]
MLFWPGVPSLIGSPGALVVFGWISGASGGLAADWLAGAWVADGCGVDGWQVYLQGAGSEEEGLGPGGWDCQASREGNSGKLGCGDGEGRIPKQIGPTHPESKLFWHTKCSCSLV